MYAPLERILPQASLSSPALSKKYGPLVQLGELEGEEKPRFASPRPGQLLEDITLEEAIELFKLPRKVGTLEGEEIIAQIGRFGPYLRHAGKFYSVSKEHSSVYTIKEKEAIEIIKEKQLVEKQSIIQTLQEDPIIQVRKGRWGHYIKTATRNVKLDAKIDPKTLTLKECEKIIAETPASRWGTRKKAKTTSKGKKKKK